MTINEPTQTEIDLIHLVERDFFTFCQSTDCHSCPYASTLSDKLFNCHSMYLYQRLKEVNNDD